MERKAMNRPNLQRRKPSKRVLLPRWMALILTPVVFLLGHVLIGGGWAGLVWCLRLHFVASGDSFEMERTQNYLVVRGPYQFTRNPMYPSGMGIWLGWVIFYGSVAVLVGFVVVWMSVAFLVVPWEERKLEARIGEAYLRYKNTVPRWLGKRSR